jgi:exo-beta-1,3-glucanase (GH17 family)
MSGLNKSSAGINRRDFIKLSLATGIFAALPKLSESAEPLYKPLKGLCYGPFREGQSPEWGVYPTESQIREDINIIKSIAPKIRTYGTENILYRIPEFCRDAGVYCSPGAWIDNASADNQQITNLIAIGNLNYATTQRLVVGNEYLYRHTGDLSKLVNYIRQVKSATGKKVCASEQWHIWRDYPSLATEVDEILVHVHPYWENISISNAAQFVLEKYNYVKGLYPGKKIIISETGWPTQGPSRGSAVPSEANQDKFLSDFISISSSNNIDYILFEAFDEPWKGEGGVGAWWGVFDKSRNLKQALENVLKPQIIGFDGDKIKIRTYEGDSYSIDRSTNLLNNSWQNITNVVGSANTNMTDVTAANNGFAKAFYRASMKYK